jgi:hypothetical protein
MSSGYTTDGKEKSFYLQVAQSTPFRYNRLVVLQLKEVRWALPARSPWF